MQKKHLGTLLGGLHYNGACFNCGRQFLTRDRFVYLNENRTMFCTEKCHDKNEEKKNAKQSKN